MSLNVFERNKRRTCSFSNTFSHVQPTTAERWLQAFAAWWNYAWLTRPETLDHKILVFKLDMNSVMNMDRRQLIASLGVGAVVLGAGCVGGNSTQATTDETPTSQRNTETATTDETLTSQRNTETATTDETPTSQRNTETATTDETLTSQRNTEMATTNQDTKKESEPGTLAASVDVELNNAPEKTFYNYFRAALKRNEKKAQSFIHPKSSTGANDWTGKITSISINKTSIGDLVEATCSDCVEKVVQRRIKSNKEYMSEVVNKQGADEYAVVSVSYTQEENGNKTFFATMIHDNGWQIWKVTLPVDEFS